jgi:hypothetical protein
MRLGISCSYIYAGDEEPWEQFVDSFMTSIRNDAEIRDRFHYLVNIGRDGATRVHIGHWDSEETLQILMGRSYFREFAVDLHRFGGNSLQATFFRNVRTSRGWRMDVV